MVVNPTQLTPGKRTTWRASIFTTYDVSSVSHGETNSSMLPSESKVTPWTCICTSVIWDISFYVPYPFRMFSKMASQLHSVFFCVTFNSLPFLLSPVCQQFRQNHEVGYSLFTFCSSCLPYVLWVLDSSFLIIKSRNFSWLFLIVISKPLITFTWINNRTKGCESIKSYLEK